MKRSESTARDPAATVAELIRRACADSLKSIERWRPDSLRLKAEPIHQMRAGTRRLRAMLRVCATLMDKQWAAELEAELRWLAHVLGTVRDLDVLRARLRESTPPEDRISLRPIQRMLGVRHRDAQSALKVELRSSRFDALLQRLRTAALAPELLPSAEAAPLPSLLPLRHKAWKKLSRSARALQAVSDADEYHHVRKLAKRLRYVSEAILPGVHHDARDTEELLIERLKKLQDLLGEMHDATVAETTLTLALETEHYRPDVTAAAKRLRRTQARSVRSVRKKFPRYWRQIESTDPSGKNRK